MEIPDAVTPMSRITTILAISKAVLDAVLAAIPSSQMQSASVGTIGNHA